MRPHVSFRLRSSSMGDIRANRIDVRGLDMNMNEPVTLKSLWYILFGGGAIALVIVAAVWAVLGIFVI